MLLTSKNEISILYSGECRNTYFEIKRSGGSDEQNKYNKVKIKKGFLRLQVLRFITSIPRGGTSLFGLYGDVPLDRVWFFGLAVLNRVYNLTCICPKQVKNLS